MSREDKRTQEHKCTQVKTSVDKRPQVVSKWFPAVTKMEAGRRLGRSLRKWENAWERILIVHARVARQSQNKYNVGINSFLSLQINPRQDASHGHGSAQKGRRKGTQRGIFGSRWGAIVMAGVNILVGIRALGSGEHERCAHIRWKIKQAGISAHKGSGNMALPCSHSWTNPSKFCAKS